ncbi:50S ribosomal protein L4 [Candidatus Nasuia deltocephalinicola]|nr:50S ribosomal protein L4 [Candidatus Nasuia deltocephalinicola]
MLFKFSKSRSFINFSKKIEKSKGSGKARVGSANSPTRRSGARAFPNLFLKIIKKF